MASDQQTILVVGGNGNLGAPVARRLARDGFRIRILTRQPEKARKKFDDSFEIFVGDVEDPPAIERAMAGCYGVHISLRGSPAKQHFHRFENVGTGNVVAAARALGVKRLSYLSDLYVSEERAHFDHIRAKLGGERAVRESGIPFVILAPSSFMDSLVHLRRRERTFIPRVTCSYHWIAAEDYAGMVSRFHQESDAPNRRIDVFGPEPIPFLAAARRYCAIARPGVRVVPIPPWAVFLVGCAQRNPNIRYSARVMKLYQQVGEPGDPATADRSLGVPTTTFDEWCAGLRAA